MMGGARLGKVGPNRLLIFKLDGGASLPPEAPSIASDPDPPKAAQSPSEVSAGRIEYATYCSRCHGANAISGGTVPDLRHSPFLGSNIWLQVVLHGLLANQGMANFSKVLDESSALAIRDYVIDESQKAAAAAPP